MASGTTPSKPMGRRPSTTRGQLSDLGIELFTSKGFDETSIDDIADAAGIARRTFFRYFPSKNAVPWGDFDAQLAALRAHLDGLPDDIALPDALRSALLQFNTFPLEEAAIQRATDVADPGKRCPTVLLDGDVRGVASRHRGLCGC